MEDINKNSVPVMAALSALGVQPEYLYWVGCAGAFDDRYKKVTRAFVRILNHLRVSYAVLGSEESCTGDPARRAGNEMLYQMQAFANIETFKKYNVTRILTTCPHCFNILKNEYPDLGGKYDVIHYTTFLHDLYRSGVLKADGKIFSDQAVTYHDPCYLGRANDIYDEPRELIRSTGATLREMPRSGSFALCCGAGGSQMFKEAEKGVKEVFIERTGEAVETGAKTVVTACPFCMVMITDGIKYLNREEGVKNLDLAEMIAASLGL